MRLTVPALFAGTLWACAGSALAQSLPNDPAAFLAEPPKPSSLRGPFRLVSIGELLYSKEMADSKDAEFQKVRRLAADGTVTVAIQEGPFLDLAKFRGVPGAGGLWGVPEKARDEKAMGIDMVSVANNHSTDWGWEGLKETQRLLDEAGIVHSGAGPDLQSALRPGILATPNGRIALVSTASTFRPYANATDRYGDAPARPGISVLRTRRINLVTPAQFCALRAVAIQSAQFSKKPLAAPSSEIMLGGQAYRAAAVPGITYEMNVFDHAGLLRAVRQAKQESDFVIFTIHAHESPTGQDDDNPQAPDFLETLFHNAVDAGADFVLGGGQHASRGLEIYKGRPILYGIGAYFLSGDIRQLQDVAHDAYPREDGTPPPPPSPADRVTANPGGRNPARWYDGMVVVTDYDGQKLQSLKLYPLDLGNTLNWTRRGIPHLAAPGVARRILSELQHYSQRYGTQIDIEGSVGVVRVP